MSVRETLVQKMDLPADVFLDSIVIEMTGKYELIIRNFRQMKEYEENQIRVSGKNERICICGKNLRIHYYAKSEVHITGMLQSVTFE